MNQSFSEFKQIKIPHYIYHQYEKNLYQHLENTFQSYALKENVKITHGR